MPYLSALATWLLFLLIAVFMGAIREKLLRRIMGESAARLIGSLALCAAIFLLTRVYLHWAGPGDPAMLLALGAGWALATVAFECFMGRVLMRMSWREIFADYNVFKGRFWPLVPLVLLFGPLLASRL